MQEGQRLTKFTCRICRRSVTLKECITDDVGEPVHIDCYAELKAKEPKKEGAESLIRILP
jgi:hypothetical protein